MVIKNTIEGVTESKWKILIGSESSIIESPICVSNIFLDVFSLCIYCGCADTKNNLYTYLCQNTISKVVF